MNDKDLKAFFKAHQTDIVDDGFSKQVMRQLPARTSILPQIVMAFCIVVGLTVTILIQGIDTIILNLTQLITAIGNLQMPSIQSLVTYLAGLAILGCVGFAIGQTASE